MPSYSPNLVFMPARLYVSCEWCAATLYCASCWVSSKLQALVYDILPSTTAVFSYAIGSRKLSANEQFFVGAQTVVSLLQTTQIISGVCFISDHVATPAQIKPKSFESRQNSFCYPGWMHLMFTWMLGR